MTIIKRRLNKKSSIDKLADQLADKPYGESIDTEQNELTRTTISLPSSLLFKLEDIAKKNKRQKKELKSVSALIRHYVEQHL